MSGRSKSNFSIEHILNVAGNSAPKPPPDCPQLTPLHFDWLNCTRYRPPRIQRPKKKEGAQRRNPGRNPRIPFSPAQVALLEAKFQRTPYLSSHEVQQVASSLQLSETRIKIWFQNRRARERREIEPKETKKDNSTTADETGKQSPLSENETTDVSKSNELTVTLPKNVHNSIIQNGPPLKAIIPPFLIPFPACTRDNLLHLGWLLKN